MTINRRIFAGLAFALALPAAGPAFADATMDAVLAGAWRSEADKARDAFRHPKETLGFFGLKPGQTVVEIWPGGGWYTAILAPYAKASGGTYIAAGFDPNGANEYQKRGIEAFRAAFVDKADIYGPIKMSAFGRNTGPLAPENSVDLIVTFRNLHNWIPGGFADKAFKDFYAALKPGGVLGVVDHRMPAGRPENVRTGYVLEATAIGLAEAAGFKLEARSEINANPKDTADHPFGVWTLPPTLRSGPAGQAASPDFDQAKYKAIGESDRFTLKFVKPTP